MSKIRHIKITKRRSNPQEKNRKQNSYPTHMTNSIWLVFFLLVDMFENCESDNDIVEKSDGESPRSESPVPVKHLAPKNKRGVAVDRSYIDEEGFMGKNRFYSLIYSF